MYLRYSINADREINLGKFGKTVSALSSEPKIIALLSP